MPTEAAPGAHEADTSGPVSKEGSRRAGPPHDAETPANAESECHRDPEFAVPSSTDNTTETSRAHRDFCQDLPMFHCNDRRCALDAPLKEPTRSNAKQTTADASVRQIDYSRLDPVPAATTGQNGSRPRTIRREIP